MKTAADKAVIKLPVRVGYLSRKGQHIIVDATGRTVATCEGEDTEEAHAIATALNGQSKLVEACEAALRLLDVQTGMSLPIKELDHYERDRPQYVINMVTDQLNSAIAAARGKG